MTIFKLYHLCCHLLRLPISWKIAATYHFNSSDGTWPGTQKNCCTAPISFRSKLGNLYVVFCLVLLGNSIDVSVVHSYRILQDLISVCCLQRIQNQQGTDILVLSQVFPSSWVFEGVPFFQRTCNLLQVISFPSCLSARWFWAWHMSDMSLSIRFASSMNGLGAMCNHLLPDGNTQGNRPSPRVHMWLLIRPLVLQWFNQNSNCGQHMNDHFSVDLSPIKVGNIWWHVFSPLGTRTYGNLLIQKSLPSRLVWCLDDVGLSILQLVKLFKLKDSAILHSEPWWNGQKFMMKFWLFLARSSHIETCLCGCCRSLNIIEASYFWHTLDANEAFSISTGTRYPFKLPESLCLSNNFSNLQFIFTKKQSNSWRQKVLQGKMREASLGSVFSSSSGQQTGSFGWEVDGKKRPLIPKFAKMGSVMYTNGKPQCL